MAKQLLIERSVLVKPIIEPTKIGYLQESVNGEYIVKLPVTNLGIRNENGRIYSRAVMEKAIRECREQMEARTLLCSCLEHPNTESGEVPPGEASHCVIDAWCDDDYLYNKWLVFNTTNGNNLKALIDAGVALGVSIRGYGSVDRYGNILDDYEYRGTDVVSQPSSRLWVTPVKDTTTTLAPTEGKIINPKPSSRYESVLHQLEQMISELKSESNLVDATSLAMKIESFLAEESAHIKGREVAKLYTLWEQVKNELFNTKNISNTTKDAKQLESQSLTESADQSDYDAKIRSLVNMFRTELIKIRESALRESLKNKRIINILTKKLEYTQQKLSVVERKLSIAEALFSTKK